MGNETLVRSSNVYYPGFLDYYLGANVKYWSSGAYSGYELQDAYVLDITVVDNFSVSHNYRFWGNPLRCLVR